MRRTLVLLLSGWILSTWVQVPLFVQNGLRAAARWVKARISDQLAGRLAAAAEVARLRLPPE